MQVANPDEVVRHHPLVCANFQPPLEGVVGQLRDRRLLILSSVSPLQHADETGVRIAGKRHWLHVNSTRFLTHLAWHAKRGRQALEDIGIWPRFRGRAMRDRLSSYDHSPCTQSTSGAC